MLRTHLLICSILVLLGIPVYLIDHFWLKSSGGTWISLDFSKLLMRAYLVFLLIHCTISTIAIIYYHPLSLFKTHLIAAVISLLLLGLGFYSINSFADGRYRKNQEAAKEQRKAYFNDIRIVRWWIVPDAKNPKEIHADVAIAADGRFSADVTGQEEGDKANTVFSSDGKAQRLVKAGETIHYLFPLTIDRPGEAKNIAFTFYLFKHPAGESGPDDVSKVFKKSVGKSDDGQYFYESLVPPLEKEPN